jgi:hypothetical protein
MRSGSVEQSFWGPVTAWSPHEAVIKSMGAFGADDFRLRYVVPERLS